MASDTPKPPALKPRRLKYAHRGEAMPPEATFSLSGVTPEDGMMAVAYMRIGRVATLWAAFEQALDDTLWSLAGVEHDRGACLTSQMGSSFNRLIALEALAKLAGADKALLGELNKIAKKWHGLNDKRNRVVHNPVFWSREEQSVATQVIIIKRDLGLDYQFQPVNLDDYHSIGNDILKFFNDFAGFRERLLAVLPPF